MKARWVTLRLLICLWPCTTGLVAGQSARTTVVESDSAREKILAADEARRTAMLHGDAAALEPLLASDVTIIWGDGTIDDKQSVLALFRSGALKYERLEYSDTRVRLYGSTAVLTGKARVVVRSGAHLIESRVWVTRVYIEQNHRWLLVASQSTRLH